MLYGLETVSLKKRQESELEVAELKMLRFSLGVTRLDRIRNEYIRGTAHVGHLGDKVREARLRWFGHVQRREIFYARFEAQNDVTARKTIPPPEDQVPCLTRANVRTTLCRVNPPKAAGPDNMPGRVLRECAEQPADVFTDIFNNSLRPQRAQSDHSPLNINVEIVKSTKFLGVHLVEDLTWSLNTSSNTSSITKKAQQHLYFL
ncbi:hypothetical protein QTP70_025993 [Hemibagrus guttatus]|uniref:Alkylated DNA repair protein AlkB homologue 8 N-terminal domain-containing protein n=1 Tax=Hemibagrus guttatus TaxID=175788 RepID=A0AAE0R709_9TELE|nr:hypothetical protein QTP70_025993 [Hemibagrus guttatus]